MEIRAVILVSRRAAKQKPDALIVRMFGRHDPEGIVPVHKQL
jgi:hypothetical protein